MPIHDRLKHARERAGLSGAQVKERIGVGESSLSEFENGKREPSLNQLNKLAKLYQRSLTFFFSEEPIQSEPAVLWREKPKENIEEIEARFLRLGEQYHNLEVWCNEKISIRLPNTEGVPDKFNFNDAEELAKRILRELNLGDRPGQCLLAVLEEVCGVKVFHIEFEPSGVAASVVSGTFGASVLLNTKNVRWRRNFDLAHELFHLLTWSIFHSSADSRIVCGEGEEKLANSFAANLLMPIDPFRTAINLRMHDGKIAFDSLFDVAREFDVSIDSLLWRMHFVYGRGPDNSDQTEQDIEHAKHLAPLLEKRENQKPEVFPERYRALAIKALRRGEISIGRFAEYLSISRQEAMRYTEQEVQDSEEVQVTAP